MTRFWHPVADMHAVAQSGELCSTVARADVWDATGRRYLDATAGLWYATSATGASEIVDAAAAQMRRLHAYSHYGDVSIRPTTELAERIAAFAPIDDAVVFFTSGGGESIETAVKLVRRYWSLAASRSGRSSSRASAPTTARRLRHQHRRHGGLQDGVGPARWRHAARPLGLGRCARGGDRRGRARAGRGVLLRADHRRRRRPAATRGIPAGACSRSAATATCCSSPTR